MNIQFSYRAFGLVLPVLLAACGVGNPSDVQLRTAATIETRVQAADATASANAVTAAAAAAPAATVPTLAANMPQPDCVADGCKGLRIIDANAEAFRYAALHRADAPQS